jgi:HlyD family secretion protein
MQTAEQQPSLVARLLPKSTGQWIVMGVAGGVIATLGLTAYILSQSRLSQANPVPSPTVNATALKSITALGRLEPQGEVIKIAASNTGSRVAQLLVKQGDSVKKGQIIAILDSRDRLQAELEQAQEQVRVAQSRLAQVKAGAKTGEIGAQQATIQRLEAQWRGDRQTQQATLNRLEAQVQGDIEAQQASIRKLEAEFQNAKAEYRRYQQLRAEGAISESIYDSKRLALETSQQQLQEARAALARTERTGHQQIQEARATLERTELTGRQQINEAQATLAKVAEVRPVDVQTAQTEVDSAIAAVKKAQAELELAYVRSTRNGQILKIHTWEGEIVGDEGIVELGQTNQMVAIAEVYESDVQRVRLGQTAAITSSAFSGEAKGSVEQIGLQIYKNNVLNTDPTTATDARVVEVKIRLDEASSSKVSGFTHLEVTVAIDPQSQSRLKP